MLPFRSNQLTIVAQCFDEMGVIRCPVDEQGYFGLSFSLSHELSPSQSVRNYLRAKLHLDSISDDDIEIISLVEPSFSQDGLDPTMLYLVKISAEAFRAPVNWPTFISYLKKLSSGPERIAYNKAFQFFAGAHKEEVDVLEVDETVKKALESMVDKLRD